MVLQEYPKQALWLFMSVVKSTKPVREQRGRMILDRLRVGLKMTVRSPTDRREFCRVTLSVVPPALQT